MNGTKRIVLAGGSGFLGRALAKALRVRNYDVVVLTRTPRERSDGVKEAEWTGEHVGEWIKFLDGAKAIVNLTGRNINCPHTPENLRDILESRVNSANAIAQAFGHVRRPPRVWVQASATGFYGDTQERVCGETAPSGSDALSKICRDWENALTIANLPETRKVIVRIGFVLGRGGGALPVLARLTKFFLGGAAGSGKQFISWIHLADLMQMFIAAIEREDLSGTFNAVAPNPVRNADFMRGLRRVLHRPWSPPAPEFAVRLGAKLMGSEPSLALLSQRCVPERFFAAGFEFQFPELRPALEDLFRD
jgi:uncharacterized protein (TIGR01777 family)